MNIYPLINIINQNSSIAPEFYKLLGKITEYLEEYFDVYDYTRIIRAEAYTKQIKLDGNFSIPFDLISSFDIL